MVEGLFYTWQLRICNSICNFIANSLHRILALYSHVCNVYVCHRHERGRKRSHWRRGNHATSPTSIMKNSHSILCIFLFVFAFVWNLWRTWHVSMTKGVANQSWSKTYNVRELSIVLHCVFSTTISRLICTFAQGFVFCSLHNSKHTWPSGHINVKLNPTGGAGWSSVKSSIWSLS